MKTFLDYLEVYPPPNSGNAKVTYFDNGTPYNYETTSVKYNLCPYCNGIHDGVCPRIKSIEYYPNGVIKRVEFYGQSNR